MMSAMFIAYLLNFLHRLFMVLEENDCNTSMQIRQRSKIKLYNDITTTAFVSILLLLTKITKMANG